MVDEPPRSAHVDQFVRQRLPPADLWPRMEWSGVPELAYPDRLNCAEELLDRWIAAGDGRLLFSNEQWPSESPAPDAVHPRLFRRRTAS